MGAQQKGTGQDKDRRRNKKRQTLKRINYNKIKLTCLARIEPLLYRRQQITGTSVRAIRIRNEMRRIARQPAVLQRLQRRRTLRRVERKTRAHKVACSLRNIRPVFLRLEGIVARADRFHLLLLGVSVEGRVPTEEEIGDDAHGPDVDGFAVSGCV